MKTSKRIFSLFLVFLIAVCCFVPAAAEGEDTNPIATVEPGKAIAAAPAVTVPVYRLTEETLILEDATPLGAGPTERDCCVLHFILMLGALGVAVYYTYDRKKGQKREFELRSEL